MRATLQHLRHPRRGAVVLRLAEVRRPVSLGDVPATSMPYGAPELKAVARRYLLRGLALACALWGAAFVVSVVAKQLVPRATVERSVVVVPYRELSAPPPLTQTDAPPQIAVAPLAAAPTVGIPIPVPDAEAPPEQTIASQEEIAAITPTESMSADGDHIVVAPPAAEELPKFGDYVYFEELPEAVTRVSPQYPDMARDANVDGTVLVQALVGRDGRVHDVRVMQSIPMLDEAAVAAVRKWVFKPALANNKPVAVWVAIPVRFTLQGG